MCVALDTPRSPGKLGLTTFQIAIALTFFGTRIILPRYTPRGRPLVYCAGSDEIKGSVDPRIISST